MSRITFAWELGGGYGHINSFIPIAHQLFERGHSVSFLVKDLATAEALAGRYGFEAHQIPVHWQPDGKIPAAITYPQILLGCGFNFKNDLLARVKALRRLFDWLQPELLICDHAPTALVAARSCAIPCALLGTGFFSPPKTSPMPSMRPWLNVPEQPLIASEQRVLTTINEVFNELKIAPLETLANLFDTEEDFLCTLPELDHYQGRSEARYWGPRFNVNEGVEPSWPISEKAKIFGYLSNAYSGLETLLQQLRNSPFQVLMHVSGISPDLINKYTTENLQLTNQPVKLAQTGRHCDLVICHGSHGTVAAALLAGLPILALPMHLDHFIIARNINNHRLGAFIHPDNKKPHYRRAINQLLSEKIFNQEIKKFSSKYSEFHPDKQNDTIANRCEEIIARH